MWVIWVSGYTFISVEKILMQVVVVVLWHNYTCFHGNLAGGVELVCVVGTVNLRGYPGNHMFCFWVQKNRTKNKQYPF